MFEIFLFLTFLVCVGGVLWGTFGFRDTLHPLVYLMPMAGFIYVYIPIQLRLQGGLQQYFTLEELVYVQGINFLGLLGLLMGCVYGSKELQRDPGRIDVLSAAMTPKLRQLFFRMGVAFGIIGFLAYAFTLYNVGGFVEAYSRVKGGGWAGSGYIRDLDYMLVPAIIFVYLSRSDRPIRLQDWILVGVFSFPFAARGVLTARRGPTFLFFALVFGGWYLTRRQRPSLPTLAAGGGLIGLLMLTLVTFRGQIYLGSSFLSGEAPPVEEIIDSSLEWTTTPTLHNEYLYGTYVIMNAREEGKRYYGRRYLTQMFVRPIPRSIWPNKYEDVGMEAITENGGVLFTTNPFEEHPRVSNGAATGVVASAFVEWGGWGAPVFLFVIGWIYALAWRKTLVVGGVWTVLYAVLLGMSAYCIAQNFYAIFYRLLLMGIPPAALWYLFRPRREGERMKAMRNKAASHALP